MTNKEKAEVLHQLYGYLCGDPEKEAPEYSKMQEAMEDAIDILEFLSERCIVADRSVCLTSEQRNSIMDAISKVVKIPTHVLTGDYGDATKIEPLTLEQLRGMDGKPVWVQTPGIEKYGRWVIVAGVDTEGGQKTLYCQGDYTCRDYGKSWEAYAYPPAHIDREAWEPCGACKDGEITIHVPEFRAMAVCNQHMDHEAFDLTLHLKFCPWCGRPMTEDAWTELEKRLRQPEKED